MTVVINGTSGITDVNGTAAAPAITGTDTDTGVFFGTNTVSLSTGGTERLQVDSSGNAGLGVTPSAWSSAWKALQINTTSSLVATSSGCFLNNNNYFNGTSNLYLTTDFATRYLQTSGEHRFYNAPSGTAGNAITFTQAMTLDASGRLLVGRTSSDANNFRFQISQSTDTYGSGIELTYAGVGSAGIWENSSGALCFGNDNASGTTERARINTNGFFKAKNTGSYINENGNYHEFINGNAIDGISGLIACFSSSSVGAGTSELLTATYRNASPNNTTHRAIVVSDNANNRMIVYSNGNIQNANNSYGALSDVKIKENIVDATPKLAKLCQVRVVNYNVIGETQKQIGVVAQELEQLFPSMVDECPDYETVTTVDEDGNERSERVATGTSTKGVKYSVFVPMLIKAIQEQQAIITQLQADVAALKAKA